MDKPTQQQLQAELDRLRAENARLTKAVEAKAHQGITAIKVSDKGAVSVYGLQRMPVTLYAGQWETLLASAERILTFIRQNADKVARKPAA